MKTTKIEIQKGCKFVKCEEINGYLVTTFEPKKVEPKEGDFVKLSRGTTNDFIYAKIKAIDSKNYYYQSRVICNSIYNGIYNCDGYWFISNDTTFKILTPDKYQSEINALGFEYDFENDTYSVLKWKPKDGEEFYYFDEDLIVRVTDFSYNWKMTFNVGNCFKTESECLAKIEQIKNILK